MSDNKNSTDKEREITYRQEILSRLFGFIRRTDSFHLIGAASMGKTRLLDFIMRNDVQEHYLGNDAKNTWLIRVDLNRLSVADNWTFYFFELLLSSIVLSCLNQKNINEDIMKELVSLNSDVIKSRDFLFALRFFEWEVSKLCQKYDIKLCFLFDEFDEAYQRMPPEVFAQLRSVRDANKMNLLYGLFLRMPPKKLRPSNDNESFYELLSGNLLGIGPYTQQDIVNVIKNLEKEWALILTPENRMKIALASGGHPGFVKAFLRLIKDPMIATKIDNQDWLPWFSKQETVIEECRKIWDGLSKEERATLLVLVQAEKSLAPQLLEVAQLLVVKGILQKPNKDENTSPVFSPFFEQYIKSGRAKAE